MTGDEQIIEKEFETKVKQYWLLIFAYHWKVITTITWTSANAWRILSNWSKFLWARSLTRQLLYIAITGYGMNVWRTGLARCWYPRLFDSMPGCRTFLGSILLTRINLNPNMSSEMLYETTYPFPNFHGWTVEIWGNICDPTLNNECNYLSVLGLKLNYVDKWSPKQYTSHRRHGRCWHGHVASERLLGCLFDSLFGPTKKY